MVLKCQADNCERSEQNPKHEKSKYAIAVFEISSDNVENLLGLVGNTCHCVWIVVELRICGWNFLDRPLSFHQTVEAISDW